MKRRTGTESRVEARGLLCPLPALRLARSVREQGAGHYLLLADDPAAQTDIPALCAERGWQLLDQQPDRFRVCVPGSAPAFS